MASDASAKRLGGAVAAVYTLVLALWVGGGALYTFVLTPAIFSAYPRDEAGAIVGTMMPFYFGTTLACVAAATALFPLLRRSWPPRLRALALVLLLGALAGQGWLRWGLYPEILAVKARVPSFAADSQSPERRRFRALHGQSMALNLATLLAGAVLVALVPARRPEEP